MRAPVPDAQRVAVARRLRHAPDADIAAGAGHVLDHDRLPERAAHALGEQARDRVGRPAGRIRHDDGDRAVREGLRACEARERRHDQSAGGKVTAACVGGAAWMSSIMGGSLRTPPLIRSSAGAVARQAPRGHAVSVNACADSAARVDRMRRWLCRWRAASRLLRGTPCRALRDIRLVPSPERGRCRFRRRCTGTRSRRTSRCLRDRPTGAKAREAGGLKKCSGVQRNGRPLTTSIGRRTATINLGRMRMVELVKHLVARIKPRAHSRKRRTSRRFSFESQFGATRKTRRSARRPPRRCGWSPPARCSRCAR